MSGAPTKIKSLVAETALQKPSAPEPKGTGLSGVLVGWCRERGILVDFPGNALGPMPARSLVPLSAARVRELAKTSCEILLVFDGGRADCPIILGLLQPPTSLDLAPQVEAVNVVLDGKRLRLSAEQEIVLECGQSRLTLQRDGKVVLQGVEVVSRARRANRIRGASVELN